MVNEEKVKELEERYLILRQQFETIKAEFEKVKNEIKEIWKENPKLFTKVRVVHKEIPIYGPKQVFGFIGDLEQFFDVVSVSNEKVKKVLEKSQLKLCVVGYTTRDEVHKARKKKK